MNGIKKVLLATDLSEASQEAQEYAETLAKSLGIRLGVLHVFDHHLIEDPLPYLPMELDVGNYIDNGRDNAKKAVDEVCNRIQVECDVHLLEGNPAKGIVDFINENEVDLLIIGSHGYSGINRWILGSVAEYVVRHATCPVLTVKHGSKERKAQ